MSLIFDLSEKDISRFWSYVRKIDNGCWIWIGTVAGGTGALSIRNNGRTLTVKARRISFAIHHGRLPNHPRLSVSCDNPLCVAPDHIQEGELKYGAQFTSFQGRKDMSLNDKILEIYNSAITTDNGCIEPSNNPGDKYPSLQHSGKHYMLSNLVMEFEGYVIGDKDVVMHTCDNTRCINPRHLKIGSYSDNTQDMYLKGRNKSAKINFEIAREIRRLYATGKYTHADLEKMYGLAHRTIGSIVTNRSWTEHKYSNPNMWEELVDDLVNSVSDWTGVTV